jgi:hypothetical protein
MKRNVDGDRDRYGDDCERNMAARCQASPADTDNTSESGLTKPVSHNNGLIALPTTRTASTRVDAVRTRSPSFTAHRDRE